MINKHENNKRKKHFFITKFLRNNVVIVPIMEPHDNKILSRKNNVVNLYQNIVSIMRESTNEYYNMSMVLGHSS